MNEIHQHLSDRMKQKEELRKQILSLLDDLDRAIPDEPPIVEEKEMKADQNIEITADKNMELKADENLEVTVDENTEQAAELAVSNALSTSTEKLSNITELLSNITETTTGLKFNSYEEG